ncbi:MAG: hypothetical protein IJ572_05600 [Bacilli bacterium]|nr:hypothetical protein [Bacilli bacterium]
MKKNIFKSLLVSGVIALAPTMVNAQSANVSIIGDSTMYNDDMITLNVKVDNIKDVEEGIVALGGDIMYDPMYLTYVSATPISKPYAFDGNFITDGNYRIAGLDFTMENGIKTDTVVYSVVFKANKVGKTTISFENPDVVNANAENIETSTYSKALEILEKQEKITDEVVEEKIADTKDEVIETKVENKVETKELSKTIKVSEDVKEDSKIVDTVKEIETDSDKEVKEEAKKEENIIVTIFNSIADLFKSLIEIFKI